MFKIREESRYHGKPVNLYLFKGVEPSLEVLMRSVTIIPGTTEFGYGTTPVMVSDGSKYLNRVAGLPISDFAASIDDLLVCAPGLKHVSLVVAWHGTDLRVGVCKVKPKVEYLDMETEPYAWQVGPVTRDTADLVSQIDDKPALGGAPADRTVYEAIRLLRAKGLQVTMYPFVMMDVASGNALPNPYGGSSQPAYPWRGRITCHPAPGVTGTVDMTSAAATQVATFFGSATAAEFAWNNTTKTVTYTGTATEWSFRRFILHMATIAAAAGATDFLIGSEMVGLTSIRSAATVFPAVDRLVTLAADVRGIVGSGVKISYAADWTEYHSHKADNNLVFHLDKLWASANIDYIGIDNYFPIGDWRDGTAHLDYQAGFVSPYDKEYIQKNIEGGELFDWYYASTAARVNQVRTPITDGAYNEPWVWRQKDIRSWRNNAHYNRIAGVRQGTATAFVAGSKPIVFTELGLAAVDKSLNQPNVFVDPKSVESAFPYFSNQRPDAAIQRAGLEASLDYWRENGIGLLNYSKISLWTWDARPYPNFPDRDDYFGDAPNWQLGHWLTGRLRAGFGFEAGKFGPYAYTDAEQAITRAGITYEPWPIQMSEVTVSGDIDKSDITITMGRGSSLESEFIGFPPSSVVNLIVFNGHLDDDVTLTNFPAAWVGRVGAPGFENTELTFNCVPVSTSIQRPGLRRNYQLSCPHLLYGAECRASRNNATITASVAAFTAQQVTLGTALDGTTIPFKKYIGGMVEWTVAGRSIIRTITAVSTTGQVLYLRGNLRGLTVGATIKISLGCNRLQTDCSTLHNNILNFGGQPAIPLENPLSQRNIFY